jgi:hypothetical protein
MTVLFCTTAVCKWRKDSRTRKSSGGTNQRRVLSRDIPVPVRVGRIEVN